MRFVSWLIALVSSCAPPAIEPEPPVDKNVVEVAPAPEEVPDTVVELVLDDYLSCVVMSSAAVRCWGARTFFETGEAVPELKGVRDLTIARSDWAKRICGIRGEGQVTCLRLPSVPLGKPHLEPVAITDAVQLIAAGSEHDGLCALRKSGAVACWAQASGWTDSLAKPSPEEVVGLRQIEGVPPFTKLHQTKGTCGETAEGAFHCWKFKPDYMKKRVDIEMFEVPVMKDARAVHGDLFIDGDGALRKLVSPTESTAPPWDMPKLRAVKSGRFTCGITAEGEEVVCGPGRAGYLNESNGVLGLGHRELLPEDAWGKVKLPRRAKHIEIGSLHACALLDDGSVYCWGNNDLHQLGRERRSASTKPVRIPLVAKAKQVDSHFEVTCAVVEGDRVYCWGRPVYSQLTLIGRRAKRIAVSGGNEPTVCGHDDTHVWCHRNGHPSYAFPTTDAEEVIGGWRTVCWRKRTGMVMCGGERGPHTGALVPFGPTQVPSLVANQLFSFGPMVCARGGQVRLCLSPSSDTSKPNAFEVTAPAGLQDFDTVSSSASGLCGVKESGVTCLDIWSPKNIVAHPELAGYVPEALDSGPFHACGVRAGKVACWGSGSDGQIGRFGARTQPTEVALPFDVEQVAVGRSHTCVLSEGNVHCWGSNQHGQMARPPTDDVFSSPVRVDL